MSEAQQLDEQESQKAVSCEDCPLRNGRGIEEVMGQCAAFAALEEALEPRRGSKISSSLEAAVILIQTAQDGALSSEDVMSNIRLWGKGGADATIRSRINRAYEAIVTLFGEDALTRDRTHRSYVYRLDEEELRNGCKTFNVHGRLPEAPGSETEEPDIAIEPAEFVQQMARFVIEDSDVSNEERLNELKRLAKQLTKRYKGINVQELVLAARRIPMSDRYISEYARNPLASERNSMLSVIARM